MACSRRALRPQLCHSATSHIRRLLPEGHGDDVLHCEWPRGASSLLTFAPTHATGLQHVPHATCLPRRAAPPCCPTKQRRQGCHRYHGRGQNKIVSRVPPGAAWYMQVRHVSSFPVVYGSFMAGHVPSHAPALQPPALRRAGPLHVPRDMPRAVRHELALASQQSGKQMLFSRACFQTSKQ